MSISYTNTKKTIINKFYYDGAQQIIFEISDKVMTNVFSISTTNRDAQREVTNAPSEERHFLFNCK